MTTKKANSPVVPKQVCTMCGELKPVNMSNFYKSYSVLFKGNYENRMCCCKECLMKYAEQMTEIYGNEQKGLYEVCRLVDSYYDIELYNKLKEQTNNESPVFALFFQKINSLQQYKNKTFRDSDKNENIMNAINDLYENEKELVARWGKGFSREDLQYLEENYHEWVTHHDCEKLSIQKLVQMICIKELEIRKTREENKPTDKLEKSLIELMSSSNLTPKTMSAVNETDSSKIYGNWLKDIEQYKPAEYFQDKKLYFDYDRILEYFNRFILRPMKNLLSGSRDFDREFMIEYEDDVLEETINED